MKKELRVKTKQEFQKVLQGNRKIVTEPFILYFIENEYCFSRFGIAASKKLGHAVIRTTIRRKVRAMIQNVLKKEEIQKMDYVIVVRTAFLEKTFSENETDLQNAFQIIRRKMNEKNN